jgi:hypothetical protein
VQGLFSIMTSTRYASISAATAIAVVLAFSSTVSLAQEAQPTTTDPASPVSATPSPAPDTAPAETAAPAATDTSASVTTRRVKHTTRVAAAKPAPAVAPAVAHQTTRIVTTHATIPAAAAPATVAAASTPAANAPTKLNPIVDVKAKPANAHAQAAKPAQNVDETAMIAGGGAFALLALGGGAYALARRRRRRDEEAMLANEADAVDEPGIMGRQDPIFEHEPPVIAPSAFAWGNAQPVEQQAATQADDRKPGETWVERAYRGPSADNPSLSLRKRLKRAAFFDKRDREVAAGMAKPVEADAGLPESVDEPADSGAPSTYERELEAA